MRRRGIGIVLAVASVGTMVTVAGARADETRSGRVDAVLEATDGTSGYLLREIGGDVLASRNAEYVFEPASSIKVLYHLHALLEVQAGSADLAETVHTSTLYMGSCPVAPPLPPSQSDALQLTVPETLERALELMMERSDNARTQTIRRRFGRSNVNATARALGLEDTEIRHEIGCLLVSLRDEVPYVPAVSELPGTLGPHYANRFTLADASRLYELALGDGTSILTPSLQDDMKRLMNGLDREIAEVVEQEADALGIAVPSDFWDQVDGASKSGSYLQLEARLHLAPPPQVRYFTNMRPTMGWLRLPFRSSDGEIATTDYTYGVFVDRGTDRSTIDVKRDLALRELVRPEIRRALTTFSDADGGT